MANDSFWDFTQMLTQGLCLACEIRGIWATQVYHDKPLDHLEKNLEF